MFELLKMLIVILFVVLFFVIVAFEQKKIKMVIANDCVMLKWRKLTCKKVALQYTGITNSALSINGTSSGSHM